MMKRAIFFAQIFFLGVVIASQAGAQAIAQEALEINSLEALDTEVRKQGISVSTRLAQLPAGSKIRVQPFLFMGSLSLLGSYWQNELQSVLVEKSGSAYTVLNSPSAVQNVFTVSGEIQRLGNVTRIYAKLVDTATFSILNIWHSDFRLSGQLGGMLSATQDPAGSARGHVQPDMSEIDSMEQAVVYELGSSWVYRTIHRGDSDWFIITPSFDTELCAETSGNLDTQMMLFNAGNREEMDSDDDSGSDTNASIIWNARAGQSYILKVTGYDNSETGSYGFSVSARE